VIREGDEGAEFGQLGKPAPEGYVEAARRLSVDPRRCLVLEDAPVGVQAGVASGASVIGVLTTFTSLDGCLYCVPDLDAVRRTEGSRRAPAPAAVRIVISHRESAA